MLRMTLDLLECFKIGKMQQVLTLKLCEWEGAPAKNTHVICRRDSTINCKLTQTRESFNVNRMSSGYIVAECIPLHSWGTCYSLVFQLETSCRTVSHGCVKWNTKSSRTVECLSEIFSRFQRGWKG